MVRERHAQCPARTNGKLWKTLLLWLVSEQSFSMQTCFSQSVCSPDVIHLLGTQSPDARKRPQLLAQSHSSDLKVIAAFLENVLVTAANYTSLQREYRKQGLSPGIARKAKPRWEITWNSVHICMLHHPGNLTSQTISKNYGLLDSKWLSLTYLYCLDVWWDKATPKQPVNNAAKLSQSQIS